ncbi:MAG: LysM domain-containing protein [Planctomycetota bacterium]
MRTLIYPLGLALCLVAWGCGGGGGGGGFTVAAVSSGSSGSTSSQGGGAPVGSGAVSGLYSLSAVHGAVVYSDTASGERFGFVDDQGIAYVVSDTASLAAFDAHPGSYLTLDAVAAVSSAGPHVLERIERLELDDVVTVASRQLSQGVAPLPVLRSSAGETFAVEGPLAAQIAGAAMQVPLFVTGVRGTTNAQGEVALRVTSWRASRQVRYERWLPGGTAPVQVASMDDVVAGGGTYHLSTDQPATSGDVVYVVQAGDTLGAIAATYNTTVAAIAARNMIANVNVISVGMQLVIPGAGQATPALRSGADGRLDALDTQTLDGLVAGVDFANVPRQFAGDPSGFTEVLRYGDSGLAVQIEVQQGATLTPALERLRDHLRDFEQAPSVSRYERLERGLDSAVTAPAIHVIRDAATLATVWQQHDPTGAAPLPAVDFSQEALIAVFLGAQATVGGVAPAVRVERLERLGSALVLDTARDELGGVVAASTTPYELLRVSLAGANGRVFTDRAP